MHCCAVAARVGRVGHRHRLDDDRARRRRPGRCADLHAHGLVEPDRACHDHAALELLHDSIARHEEPSSFDEFGGPDGAEARRRSRSDARARSGGRARPRGRRESGRRRTSAPARTRASRRCPSRPGSDGAGEIESVGADVKDFSRRRSRVHPRHVGEHVAGATADVRRAAPSARPTQLHRLPARMSFAQGAALGVPYATAYRALFQRADARPGETVLVHGATGGVGIAAVQLAHAHGMTVIGTRRHRPRADGRPRARRRRRRQPPARRLPRRDHARDRRPRRRRRSSRWRRTSTSTGISACSRRAAASSSSATAAASRSTRARRWAATRRSSGMTLFNVSDPDLASIHAAHGRRPRQRHAESGRRPRDPARRRRAAHEAVMAAGALGKIVLVP